MSSPAITVNPTVIAASQEARTGKISPVNGLAVTLAASPLIYGLGFRYFRELGEPALICAMACSVASVAIHGKVIASRIYLIFFSFSTFILLVSLGKGMPRSWTIYHDNIAAIRHWVWIPMVPLLISNFHLLFRVLHPFMQRHPLAGLAGAYAVSRLATLAQVQMDGSAWRWQLNTFTNDATIIMVALMYGLFYTRRLALQVLLVLAAALTFNSMQVLLYLPLLVLVRLMRRPGIVVWAAAVIAGAGLVLGPLLVHEIHTLDANSGIRAVLWRDVWEAMRDTAGIGVGFGTEYITNDFQDVKDEAWALSSESDPGRLFVATHSTIYDVLFRVGFLGCGIFLMWFLRALRAPGAASLEDRRMAAAVGALAVVLNAVNNGVTAMNFVFGTSFCLALILYLRLRTEPRSEPAP